MAEREWVVATCECVNIGEVDAIVDHIDSNGNPEIPKFVEDGEKTLPIRLVSIRLMNRPIRKPRFRVKILVAPAYLRGLKMLPRITEGFSWRHFKIMQ
jgi:hypothetical protein